MLRHRVTVLLAMGLLLVQVACASVISGTRQKISVQSTPPGANVQVDGRPTGQTPLVTKVKRNKRHEILITKEGYLPDSRSTGKAFNYVLLGNILVGGLIGMTIDLVDGAAYTVEPNKIVVTLIEAPASDQPSEDSPADPGVAR